jgi:hypothetical protein
MHAAVNILQEQIPEGAHGKPTELSCRQPLPLSTLSPESRSTSKQGYILISSFIRVDPRQIRGSFRLP